MSKETRSVSTTGGAKGVKKQDYSGIPPYALTQLSTLYGNGARKYDAHNYRRGYEQSKSYAALQRHANLFWAGENKDAEMGLSHLCAVAWHTFTLIELQELFPQFDDRPYAYAGDPGYEPTPVSYLKNDENVLEPERIIEGFTARFDLLPLRPMALVAEVYGKLGVPKLGPWGVYYGKMQLHLNAYWGGHSIDEETGLHNVALAAYYALTLLDFSDNEDLLDESVLYDDRFIVGAANIGFDSVPEESQ